MRPKGRLSAFNGKKARQPSLPRHKSRDVIGRGLRSAMAESSSMNMQLARAVKRLPLLTFLLDEEHLDEERASATDETQNRIRERREARGTSRLSRNHLVRARIIRKDPPDQRATRHVGLPSSPSESSFSGSISRSRDVNQRGRFFSYLLLCNYRPICAKRAHARARTPITSPSRFIPVECRLTFLSMTENVN